MRIQSAWMCRCKQIISQRGLSVIHHPKTSVVKKEEGKNMKGEDVGCAPPQAAAFTKKYILENAFFFFKDLLVPILYICQEFIIGLVLFFHTD